MIFAVVVVGALVVLVLAFPYLSSYLPIQKVTAPNPTPTSTPTTADITLTPSTQTVVLSLHQTPSFKTTINQNGHGSLVFPCSITIVSSVQMYGMSSYTSHVQPRNCGSYNFEVFIPNPSQAETISYYAVIQDSNGAKITSNTVTVEYK